jgi:uncharacterized protein (DUF1697 family)
LIVTAFVAFLRGINVGSARKLPMAELRALCAKRGLERPETYIQSGNLVVDADSDADGLRILLEKEIKSQFGFGIDVVVRTARAWEKYINVNPFADEANISPNKLHLYLSRDRLRSGAARMLEQRAQSGERMRVAGAALWIDYGAKGVAGSKLTPTLIDKACGSPTTGRNWNTVLKIRAMINARA